MNDLDVLTIGEAAKLLRCSVSRIRKGFGPESMPAYRPQRMYLRRDVNAFLENQSQCARPDSSNEPAQETGGSDSLGAATRSRNQREREISAKLGASLRNAATRSVAGSPRTSGADEESA